MLNSRRLLLPATRLLLSLLSSDTQSASLGQIAEPYCKGIVSFTKVEKIRPLLSIMNPDSYQIRLLARCGDHDGQEKCR
jgi:hypothetical protein